MDHATEQELCSLALDSNARLGKSAGRVDSMSDALDPVPNEDMPGNVGHDRLPKN